MGFQDHKPTIVMFFLQFIYAGIPLTTKAALLQGMNPRAFVVYRQSIAFLLIAPVAFFTRRETSKCCMGWRSFWLIFSASLIGVTMNQNVYLVGLNLASSSVASALGNLIPAMTFLMAYFMGLEKLKSKSLRSAAKILGTIFCVGGAVVMALFRGPKLLNAQRGETWLLGCFFLFGSAFCWSLWLILQVPVTASYPDHLSLTVWLCLIGAMQSAVFTLFMEPDINAWKMSSSLELFCCFYTGLASAVTFFAQAWCIAKRGPLFSAMFNPLCTVIVTIFACIFLREEMYTGSLLGAIAVIVGLYIVLWGKAKDHEEINTETNEVKQPNDGITTTCVESSDIESCKSDLEQLLLSEKSAS